MRRFHGVLVILVLVGITVLASVRSGRMNSRILLPGTQPGHVAPADSFPSCTPCHQDIVRDWSGSSMAHAPRDPVFNALLSITTKTTLPLGLDVSEYCLRCHSPSGWLAGRSHELTVQNLFGSDLDGVHCDFCHRMVNPMQPPDEAPVSGTVPGFGNGMYVVMPRGEPRRGPRQDVSSGHPSVQDPFLKSSEFCGICHDVSNPYFAASPGTTPPHVQPALERTYTEWKLSWYAGQGEAGTCQSCHMSHQPGKAAPGARTRLDVAGHGFGGGNTFLADILPMFWEGLDQPALQKGKERSMESLQRAARLDVAAGASDGGVDALVRVVNLTGHKLPTGFPEGRRLWLNVIGTDRDGRVLFESGRYDHPSGLSADGQLKKYEAKLGPSSVAAVLSGLGIGPSYHAAFGDSIYFDNRIPPRGFMRSAFEERRASPVGRDYQDGDYWDISHYRMPVGVVQVTVRLYYQLVTEEFAGFLRDENVGNPYDWNRWGERLYDAWVQFGQPVLMAEGHAYAGDAPPRLGAVIDSGLPIRMRLAQNFPNPFNPVTTIEFWLSAEAPVQLVIVDPVGREVARLIDGRTPAGSHSVRFDGSALSSGIYFYSLTVNSNRNIMKMVLIR